MDHSGQEHIAGDPQIVTYGTDDPGVQTAMAERCRETWFEMENGEYVFFYSNKKHAICLCLMSLAMIPILIIMDLDKAAKSGLIGMCAIFAIICPLMYISVKLRFSDERQLLYYSSSTALGARTKYLTLNYRDLIGVIATAGYGKKGRRSYKYYLNTTVDDLFFLKRESRVDEPDFAAFVNERKTIGSSIQSGAIVVGVVAESPAPSAPPLPVDVNYQSYATIGAR
eukprot:TRINITY_DN9067_c0_g1_i1.p1 TRINITY_DN9067_c0_g1~~TRINITY_DN9067_c0_g1_i1.p1  ORF type:complete len:226 (+),score=26.41 TRINITY_DN9067_c0_g1_i1:52-729(+)